MAYANGILRQCHWSAAILIIDHHYYDVTETPPAQGYQIVH